jgi:CHAD domain-containing protein
VQRLKPIHKIYASHSKKIIHYLTDALFAEEEALHQLRVEYKKLRALVRLTGKPIAKKIPIKLRAVYKAAGIVRDFQLQLIVMEAETGFTDLPLFKIQLEQNLAEAIYKLQQTDVTGLKQIVKKFVKKIPEKISSKRASQFCKKQIQILKSIIAQRTKKDEDLHRARKSVKDLLYTFHHLKEMKISFSPHLTEAEATQLHAFSDQMGKYQDRCSAVNLLHYSNLRSLPKPEKKILRQLRTKWLSQKSEEKKIILKDLRALTLSFKQR